MDDFVLFAHTFDGKGGSKPLAVGEISKELKDKKGLTWVHLDINHPESEAWLEKEISYLDPFVVQALLAEETRPRVVEINDGVIVILRGVNLNEDANPEDMISVRMWIDKYRIISLRRRKLKAVVAIDEALKMSKGPKDSGEFLCMLINNLSDNMQLVLTTLDEQTDDIEEIVTDKPDTSLREKIINVRKQAIMFKRYLSPQREAISNLRFADVSWLDPENKRHLQENYDHLTRFIEDLDAIRDRSQIVKDELGNILSDRLNKNMYILSLFAAIFLPITFITGLLGVNVGGIPGASSPHAFEAVVAFMVILTVIQIWVFKKLKWL
jgi:zinc transporter